MSRRAQVRYPLRAVALVAAAALLFVFDMTVGFLFMALVPPLIPVYVCVLFAAGNLVGAALAYARRVSVPQAAGMLRAGLNETKVGKRALAARAA